MVSLVFTLLGGGSARAAIVPAGFQDELVTAADSPTAFAFTPDGRILVTSQGGVLRVYRDGTPLSDPALDLTGRICTNDERGLLGVAVDPSFATNHYIYLYYTAQEKAGDCAENGSTTPAGPDFPVNRVSRFTLGDDSIVDTASEAVLIDKIPSPHGNHNGGDLQFGNDGDLYVSVGDGGCDYAGDSGCGSQNDASRDPNVLLGKLLRVTVPDGGVPPDNPYTGSNSARCNVAGRTDTGKFCQETYASGFRNPWRFAFDQGGPLGTRLFVNDVGQGRWEEVDLGAPGSDYGWNVREGPCVTGSTTDCGPPPLGMTNPIYSYDHSAGCDAITAAGFVPAGAWPQQYDHAYLFGDLTCGRVWTLTPDGSGGYTASEFASGISNLIDGHFGPNGAAESYYYITWGSLPSLGEIRRITFTGNANRPPIASAGAVPTSGSVPLDVQFDSSASSDPDGHPITYDWSSATGQQAGATASHTYTSPGAFTATLTVTDDHGATDLKSIQIVVGDNPPLPVIESPAGDALFAVGEQVTLTGSASDPEDGLLPDTSLSWRVLRHHDTHTHPFLPPTQGNGVTFNAPPPEDLEATGNSYLEIYLTATDSHGLSATVEQNMHPHNVDLAFQTDPSGFALDLAGTKITAPQTVSSWQGWEMNVDAPDQAGALGLPWQFGSWSDGGASSHTIVTPATAASYTARFVPAPAPPPRLSPPPPPPPRVQALVEKRVARSHFCRVPRLRGLRVSRARSKLRRARCRYRTRGKGRVVSTRPRRGTRTSKIVLVTARRRAGRV